MPEQRKILFQLGSDMSQVRDEANKLKKELTSLKREEQLAKAAGDENKKALLEKRFALEDLKKEIKSATIAERKFQKEVNDTAKDLREKKTQALQDTTDALKGFGVAIAAAGVGLVKLAEIGAEYSNLLKANKIAIDGARESTKGLISDIDLLKASNKAAALGIDINAKEFAKLSESAIIASQAIGGDTNKAVDDLIVGLGRQSKMILDNLGIMVDTDAAYREFAGTLGKTADQLTDAEKKTAFQNAAIGELDRLTQGAEISTKDFGDQVKITTATIKNEIATLGKAINESQVLAKTLGFIAEVLLPKSRATLLDIQAGGAKTLSDSIKDTDFDKVREKWEAKQRELIERTQQMFKNEAKKTQAAAQSMFAPLSPKEAEEHEIRIAQARQRARDKAERDQKAKERKDEREKKKKKAKEKREADKLERIKKRKLRQNRRLEMKLIADDAKFDIKMMQMRHKEFLRIKEQERQALEERKAANEEAAAAFVATTVAALVAAESASDAMAKLVAAGIDALAQLAGKEAIKEYAKGLGKLADQQYADAALHFGAGTLWLGLSAAAGSASGAVSNATSKGSSMSSSAESKASSSSKSRVGSKKKERSDSGPKNVTNIFLKTRTGIMTRKDVQLFNNRLNQGRVP